MLLGGVLSADAGFYALVGAGAMLSGVTRMTISLTVILTEITNDASSLLPVMVAIFAARFVGDIFNISLFDAAMAHAGYPFLEPEPERHFASLCAEDVMTSQIVWLSEVEEAEAIADVLRSTTHHAFPVVRRRAPSFVPSTRPAPLGEACPCLCAPTPPLLPRIHWLKPSHRYPISSLPLPLPLPLSLSLSLPPQVDTGPEGNNRFLNGTILRYQLEVMLRKRVFAPLEPEDTQEARQLLEAVRRPVRPDAAAA